MRRNVFTAFAGFNFRELVFQWRGVAIRNTSEAKDQSSLTTPQVPQVSSVLQKFLRYSGTGAVIAIGYIDPGNWATDIEAGSRYGYALLSVILFSSLLAMIFQSLCIEVGIASEFDLAELSRKYFNRYLNVFLWILAEIGIVACDLAEVLGTALAFKLLLNIQVSTGILLTGLDTLLVLALQDRGMKRFESILLAFGLIVAGCYVVELFLSAPVWVDVIHGYDPRAFPWQNENAWYVGIGIVGATIMPHNLYLHTYLIQSRIEKGASRSQKSEAIRYSQMDTFIALSLAFFVNSAILILSGSAFHFRGQTEVTEIEQAYALLEPLLGSAFAPVLFSIALLVSGQSSTLTGTVAGQVVIDGFINYRIPAWQRRLITRILALVPAWIGIQWMGESGLGKMLVASQVILSMQLPFVVVPLIWFARNREVMRGNRVSRVYEWVCWMGCACITAANIWCIRRLL